MILPAVGDNKHRDTERRVLHCIIVSVYGKPSAKTNKGEASESATRFNRRIMRAREKFKVAAQTAVSSIGSEKVILPQDECL